MWSVYSPPSFLRHVMAKLKPTFVNVLCKTNTWRGFHYFVAFRISTSFLNSYDENIKTWLKDSSGLVAPTQLLWKCTNEYQNNSIHYILPFYSPSVASAYESYTKKTLSSHLRSSFPTVHCETLNLYTIIWSKTGSDGSEPPGVRSRHESWLCSLVGQSYRPGWATAQS